MRWVPLRIILEAEGAKASEVLGPDLDAPDRDTALSTARRRYRDVTADEIVVVSRVSWDMSMEERARLERRKMPHMGRLNNASRKPTRR
jgi:hypothetical protein